MNITTQAMKALLVNVLLALATAAAVFIAIGGGWAVAKYTGILPLKKTKKALTIDNTPITVEQVKAIGELVTASFYDETVVIVKQKREVLKKGSKKGKDTTITRIVRIPEKEATGQDELVLVQNAHARIGIDLASLSKDDLRINKSAKAIEIKLPDVKCLDFIMNPTDTDVFSEKGTWDLDQLKLAMAPARQEIEYKMNKDTMLFKKARKGAKDVITQLLSSAGYETVKVVFASAKNAELKLPPVEQ